MVTGTPGAGEARDLVVGHHACVAASVRVRGRSTILIGVFGGALPLVVAAAPVGTGVVRGAWVLTWLAVLAAMVVRAARMGVDADERDVVIRNFGRTHRVAWDDIDSIEASASDNVTGAVTTLVIRRNDGSAVVARGASSYSERRVKRWRQDLLAAGGESRIVVIPARALPRRRTYSAFGASCP
jgi:hypothetical protein